MVNFLDVTIDLTSGKHRPYRKPIDDPLHTVALRAPTQSPFFLICKEAILKIRKTPKVDSVHISNAAIRTEVMPGRTLLCIIKTVAHQERYKRHPLYNISFPGELRPGQSAPANKLLMQSSQQQVWSQNYSKQNI